MISNKFLMCLALTILPSCSLVTNPAKDAAKEWWEDNGKNVVTDAVDAAKDYWDKHKEEIINSALDGAKQLSDSAVIQATAYVDAKLQEQRNKVVAKLIENGATLQEIDKDLSGEVSDEELQDYVTRNPMALWYAGGAIAAWWGIWQLRRRMPTPKPQISS
jgi:hypothetical protein